MKLNLTKNNLEHDCIYNLERLGTHPHTSILLNDSLPKC